MWDDFGVMDPLLLRQSHIQKQFAKLGAERRNTIAIRRFEFDNRLVDHWGMLLGDLGLRIGRHYIEGCMREKAREGV